MFRAKKFFNASRKITECRNRNRTINWKECLLIMGKGLLLITVISVLFYDSLIAVLAGCGFLPFYYRYQRKKLDQKRKEDLAFCFKEALHSILAALKAGYAIENAFMEAYGDMEYRFGKENVMVKELLYITRQIKNNVPIEQLVEGFAKKSDVSDIRDFAQIFRVAKRSGGDMGRIVERSISIITRRMETKEEIRILVAAKRYEQQIMNMVPMGIVFYIRISNPGYFDGLYHNLAGILIMTAALAVYFVAYGLSERILEIA